MKQSTRAYNRATSIKNQWISKITFLVLIVLVVLPCSLFAWPFIEDVLRPQHRTPSAASVEIATDAVELYAQPDHKIISDGVELYQNSMKGEKPMPFEIWVSPSAWNETVAAWKKEGIIQEGESVRFVIHYPGDPSGSHTPCEAKWGTNFAKLEFGREVYEHVYTPFYNAWLWPANLNEQTTRDRFLNQAADLMNSVLWHEGEHLLHCRDLDAWPSDKAENSATAAETTRHSTLPLVIFLKPMESGDFNASIHWIENLRR